VIVTSRAGRWTLHGIAWSGAVSALALVMNTAACRDAGVPVEAAQALQTLVRASFDWNHHVEIQSGENSAAGGETYYSDVSHLGQIWLLRQRAISSEWERYGMVVQNGRVYFASLDGRPRLLGAECAECHPNGPRALRGELRTGTETSRMAINTFIENIGLVRPYYAPSEPAPEETTHRLGLAPCTECHDGDHRAWLTVFNRRAITYQLARGYMPPDSELTPEQRRQVADWFARR
jgi:hypothetical protein